MIVVSGLDLALSLGGLDHAQADAVFDAATRVTSLDLDHYLGSQALGDAIEPHKGGVTDSLRDITDKSCPWFPPNPQIWYDRTCGALLRIARHQVGQRNRFAARASKHRTSAPTRPEWRRWPSGDRNRGIDGTWHIGLWAFEHIENLAQGDLFGGPGESISSSCPTLALHQPAARNEAKRSSRYFSEIS